MNIKLGEQFLSLTLFEISIVPNFVSSFISFGKRYENKLKSIFDQWQSCT